ncbi:MAG: hypothetical protein NC225_07165 [Clostridium sp.]|nr:hypothetical protein [Clostridium sp.]MCM1399242.1 hypothetical protein [Clostridium sp.]MCM1459731.1 hypothetical protein [Bacteroides sp.]
MKRSNSKVLLDYLENEIGCEMAIRRCDMENFRSDSLRECDAFVIACPLYMDGIPAKLMSVMDDILKENIDVSQRDCRVYLIINSGYYNPAVCKTAIALFRTWCDECGFILSTTVAVGAGSLVKFFRLSRGMLSQTGQALKQLATDVKKSNCSGVMLTKPHIPQRLYIFLTHMGWHHMARSNKLNMKSLKIKYTDI